MPSRRIPKAGSPLSVACAIALVGLFAALALASSLPAAEIAPGEGEGDGEAKAITGGGRIEGTVVISTQLSTRRPRFRIYADPGPGARPPAPAPESAEIRNVVLYVQNALASDAAPPRAAMEQRDERFIPHVLPLLRGTTVDFPNADDVFHNVFSLSSAKTFDLGRFPRGSAKSELFDRSGVVQVFCHIHSDMSAVVLVLDNPYFTVAAASGRYSIDGVPEGDYTVVGWHERIRPVLRTVHVTAGQTARVDFNIPLPANGENTSR